MFLKDNKFLYYLGIALVFYGILSLYNKKRAESLNRPQTEVSAKEAIKLDFTTFDKTIESVGKITSEIKNAESKNSFEVPNFRINARSFSQKNQIVSLCGSEYVIDIRILNEEGDEVYSKQGILTSQIAKNKEFYNILHKALILSNKGERVEIFVNKLGVLQPLIELNENGIIQSGIVKILVKDIIGKANLNIKGVISEAKIWESEASLLAKKPFFCGDFVNLSYQIQKPNGTILVKENLQLKLGFSKDSRLKILEYLALNSKDGNFEGSAVGNKIMSNSKEKKLIIKGNIEKINE